MARRVKHTRVPAPWSTLWVRVIRGSRGTRLIIAGRDQRARRDLSSLEAIRLLSHAGDQGVAHWLAGRVRGD